jgi:hypothetical protein
MCRPKRRQLHPLGKHCTATTCCGRSSFHHQAEHWREQVYEIQTLTRVPGSYFELTLSSRFLSSADNDDGTHFRHILNFLRDGAVGTLQTATSGTAELAAEADFYGLDGLVKAIAMPKTYKKEFLFEEMLTQGAGIKASQVLLKRSSRIIFHDGPFRRSYSSF